MFARSCWTYCLSNFKCRFKLLLHSGNKQTCLKSGWREVGLRQKVPLRPFFVKSERVHTYHFVVFDLGGKQIQHHLLSHPMFMMAHESCLRYNLLMAGMSRHSTANKYWHMDAVRISLLTDKSTTLRHGIVQRMYRVRRGLPATNTLGNVSLGNDITYNMTTVE